MSTRSTHHQFTIRVVRTVRHQTMSLKSVLFFMPSKCPEHMNAAYSRPPHNPYSQTYNPGWRNHPNFSWASNNPPRPNFSNNFHHPTPPQNFSSHAPSSSFQNSTMERKLSKLEESMEAFMKSQAAFMQNQGQS